MRKFFGLRPKYCCGLEIGEEQLQLAIAIKQSEQWKLLHTATIPLDTKSIAHALLLARKQFPVTIQHLVLAIPYHQALIKEIQLDADLSVAEINQYIGQQAANILGETVKHWYFDFAPIVSPTDLQNRQTLQVVATARATLDPWLQQCRQAGFKIWAVDVDVLALARLTSLLAEYHPQQPQAMIWLKKAELLFLVIQRSQLIYVKRVLLHSEAKIKDILSSLVQFFYRLYPQYEFTQGLLIGNHFDLTSAALLIDNHPSIKLTIATLSPVMWQTTAVIQSSAIGICTHGY